MPEPAIEPFISNEELMEVVVRFAERRGDGCTWDCPAKHGRYCLDGHAEAYSAREILRARGISHRIPLPDPTSMTGHAGEATEHEDGRTRVVPERPIEPPIDSRDERAQAWLESRHSRDWYIGSATTDDWRAAYAEVDRG